MTYKTHWSFKNGQDIPWERAVPMTIDQIIAFIKAALLSNEGIGNESFIHISVMKKQ